MAQKNDRYETATANPCPEKKRQQNIADFLKRKLAEAKPGADLTALTLRGSHEDMMNLLRSLQAKAKALQQKGGQEKGIIDDGITPKLNSLDVSLKNFKIAIQSGNRMAAQRFLNEIAETVKALGALAK